MDEQRTAAESLRRARHLGATWRGARARLELSRPTRSGVCVSGAAGVALERGAELEVESTVRRRSGSEFMNPSGVTIETTLSELSLGRSRQARRQRAAGLWAREQRVGAHTLTRAARARLKWCAGGERARAQHALGAPPNVTRRRCRPAHTNTLTESATRSPLVCSCSPLRAPANCRPPRQARRQPPSGGRP